MDQHEGPGGRRNAIIRRQDFPFEPARAGIITGPGDEQHLIGLPDAALGPRRRLRVRFVEDEIMVRFQLLQPGREPQVERIVVRGPGQVGGRGELRLERPAVEQDRPVRAGQSRAQPPGELGQRDLRAGRHQSDVDSASPLGGPVPVPEAVHEDPQDRQADHGKGLVDLLEVGLRQAHQIAVADRDHRGHPPLAGQDGHLADDLPAEDRPDDFVLAGHVAVDHAQETVDQEVQAVRLVAVGEERLAPLQVDPGEPGFDEFIPGPVDLPEVGGKDLQPFVSAKPLADDVEHPALDVRVPRKNSLRLFRRQPEERRSFRGRHRGASPAAQEEGDLPDRGTRPQLPHQDRRAGFVRHMRLKQAFLNDI